MSTLISVIVQLFIGVWVFKFQILYIWCRNWVNQHTGIPLEFGFWTLHANGFRAEQTQQTNSCNSSFQFIGSIREPLSGKPFLRIVTRVYSSTSFHVSSKLWEVHGSPHVPFLWFCFCYFASCIYWEICVPAAFSKVCIRGLASTWYKCIFFNIHSQCDLYFPPWLAALFFISLWCLHASFLRHRSDCQKYLENVKFGKCSFWILHTFNNVWEKFQCSILYESKEITNYSKSFLAETDKKVVKSSSSLHASSHSATTALITVILGSFESHVSGAHLLVPPVDVNRLVPTWSQLF